MESVNAAVLRTLIYSNIFDYPLTRDELWYFLISSRVISHEVFLKALVHFKKSESFFYLPQRKSIIPLRKKRELWSKEKLSIAHTVSKMLSRISTVFFIGISGSLALANADEDDDIDFFIITEEHTFWITRLLCLFLLQRYGMRRRHGNQTERNKVCINMFISEEQMLLPLHRRDLYTAHEIVQLRPLFSRKDTYQKFLTANSWTKKFLPNAVPTYTLSSKEFSGSSFRLVVSRYKLFEFFAKLFQIWYMKRHRTSEEVRDGFAAFHPRDYRIEVLTTYESQCKKYHI